MQSSMIVKDEHDVDKLNDLLQSGWKVIQTCPLVPSVSNGSTSSWANGRALVILEIDDE